MMYVHRVEMLSLTRIHNDFDKSILYLWKTATMFFSYNGPHVFQSLAHEHRSCGHWCAPTIVGHCWVLSYVVMLCVWHCLWSFHNINNSQRVSKHQSIAPKHHSMVNGVEPYGVETFKSNGVHLPWIVGVHRFHVNGWPLFECLWKIHNWCCCCCH